MLLLPLQRCHDGGELLAMRVGMCGSLPAVRDGDDREDAIYVAIAVQRLQLLHRDKGLLRQVLPARHDPACLCPLDQPRHPHEAHGVRRERLPNARGLAVARDLALAGGDRDRARSAILLDEADRL